jgi:hypothetical protein
MSNIDYRQDGRSEAGFAKDLSLGEQRASEFEDMFRDTIEDCCSHSVFTGMVFSDFARDSKRGKGVCKQNIIDAGDFGFAVNNIYLPIEIQCVPDILSVGKINPALNKHFKLKADVIPRCLRDGIGLFWVRPILDPSNKRIGFRFRLLTRNELIVLQKSKPTETISGNSNKPAYKLFVSDYPDHWISLNIGNNDFFEIRRLIDNLVFDKECWSLGI